MSEFIERQVKVATWGDTDSLGCLARLPGRWVSQGRGWNMIALPVDAAHAGGQRDKFRLLLNQFNETLVFDKQLIGVPNRGTPNDQTLNALRYTQDVDQLIAVDSMGSAISTLKPALIHHEPGFLMRLLNQFHKDDQGRYLDIVRLGTVPHGDSLTILGSCETKTNASLDISPAAIGDFSALPVGAGPRTLSNPYLAPYQIFHQAPFKGTVNAPGFPGFDPTDPLALLALAAPGPFKSMTVIALDTANEGGIANTPFVVEQANATEMRFVLWIEELMDSTPTAPKFQLQYAQKVMLEFFPAFGDATRRIKWPHISINTLQLV